MTTISCGYRIYPSWFPREDIMAGPMQELARNAAKNMGRHVMNIEKTGQGFDHCGGHFVDFKVTYSSTGALQEAR